MTYFETPLNVIYTDLPILHKHLPGRDTKSDDKQRKSNRPIPRFRQHPRSALQDNSNSFRPHRMIDFCSSCFNYRVEEVNESFGVCVLEVLSVGICKEASDGLDEFG
jgi:hypothetical protein